MGRPVPKLDKHGPSNNIKKKTSSSELNAKEQREKRKSHYKSKFKTYIGNSKEGHGFVAAQKRRFLSRFNRRKFRKKKNDTKEDEVVSPLNNDKSDSEEEISTDDKTRGWSVTLQDCSESSMVNSTDANNTDVSTVLSKDNESSIFNYVEEETKKKKKSTTNLKLVEIDYLAIQEERRKQYEELEANRSQHEKVVSKNIEKRKRLANKFSKRTKRGQPVMANRLENLLDKIKINRT